MLAMTSYCTSVNLSRFGPRRAKLQPITKGLGTIQGIPEAGNTLQQEGGHCRVHTRRQRRCPQAKGRVCWCPTRETLLLQEKPKYDGEESSWDEETLPSKLTQLIYIQTKALPLEAHYDPYSRPLTACRMPDTGRKGRDKGMALPKLRVAFWVWE